MEIPDKVRFAADRLQRGHRVNRITVRDFLRHFVAERRGAVKVEAIRRILDELNIESDPDFTTAWIDAPMWLRLKDGTVISPASEPGAPLGSEDLDTSGVEDHILDSTPSAVQQAEEQTETAPISADAAMAVATETFDRSFIEDPTFRIGSLPAANKKLVVVGQDDSLIKAVTLMLEYDFAQLPVMQGEREVKGVVTWKSIAAKKALGCSGSPLRPDF